jgi:hypothetical protein
VQQDQQGQQQAGDAQHDLQGDLQSVHIGLSCKSVPGRLSVPGNGISWSAGGVQT